MKPIYLEPDEEITSVIDKINAEGDGRIAVVVPKNSSLFQSLVNLKLLAREAKNKNKEVILISPDKVGARLAKQVGLVSYATLGALSGKAAAPVAPPTRASQPAVEETVIDGVKVHQYAPALPGGAEPAPADVVASPEPPVEEVHEATEELVPDEPALEATEPPIEEPTPAPEIAAEALPSIVSRTIPTAPKTPFKMPWKALAAAVSVAVVLGVVLYLFLPKATVTLVFPVKPISQTLTLVAKTTSDQSETTVPGQSLSVEKSLTQAVTATGKKDIGTKATGTVKITNKYRDGSGFGKDQTFPAGTKVTDAKTKKVFATTAAVTVGKVTFNSGNGQPIYQTQSVAVAAIEPGESYNLPVSTFTIDGALANTTIESSTAFSGGATKQVTVLSQEDVDKALADLKQKADTEAATELKTQAASQLLLDGSTWQTVKKQAVDQAVGAQVATATASYETTVSAIVFDSKVVDTKIRELMKKSLTDQEDLLIPEDKPPVLTFKSLSAAKDALELTVVGDGFAVPKLNKVVVAQAVAHQASDSVEGLVKTQFGAESATVDIFPSWWPAKLPLLHQAISVEYGFKEQP